MKYAIAAVIVIALALVLIAACGPSQGPQPIDQPGVNVDIDRSKPRKKMNAPKTAPRRK